MAERPQGEILKPELRMVAWEVTRACNLRCAHCRTSADRPTDPDELGLERCFRIVDQILSVGRPVIILTGGEPLLRKDLLEIAAYASGKGLRVVLGTNGTLLNRERARLLKSAGVSAVGVSIDYPTPDLQDEFRGVPGAFDAALRGIAAARSEGLQIQINATVTRSNASCLDDLMELSIETGAGAFHPFLLVPTGRGKELEDVALTPDESEVVLGHIYDRQVGYGNRLFIKPTDAPHYQRIMKQRQCGLQAADSFAPEHGRGSGRGCLAGTGFCFISHTGVVQGCGYFTLPAGDLNQHDFSTIWNSAPLFKDLRDLSLLKGKCGVCDFKTVCGGCRARAYEGAGDYLAAEPDCVYLPPGCEVSV